MTKNGGAAGNEGSSSNAESPRSRSAAENAPRGRGAAPRPSRPEAAVTPPPAPPVTGPPPPQAAPHWPSPPGSSGGRGRGHAAAVGVGGSPPGRKRGREDGEAAAAADHQAGGGGGEHRCSLCPNVYQSVRALFGHMRSHPDRGWKGVHPPPAFNAEEEFADLRVVDPPAAVDDGAEAPEAEKNYRVPDLNRSPPLEDDAE